MLYQGIVVDWPLDSNIIRRNSLTNTFGMVRRAKGGGQKPHRGWDFFAPEGTPCYAVSDGRVVFVGDRGDFGLLAVLQLGVLPVYAAYAHLKEASIDHGQVVQLGDQIGLTGCSGNAIGMAGLDQHLHFEIRTTPLPGLGLEGRISPFEVFGTCPLNVAYLRGS